MYVYIYVYMYECVCIYIYIYIYNVTIYSSMIELHSLIFNDIYMDL